MSRHVDLSAPDAAIWETHNLEDHMSLMKRQVDRSLADAETRRLAMQIVTASTDTVSAWGQTFKVTPRHRLGRAEDDCCAIAQLWNFTVMNVRYVRDPDDFDLFCTVRKTLEAGLGDCDDSTIVLVSLLKAVGFQDTRARVISVDGRRWAHVYAVTTRYRDGSGGLLALDPTVKDAVPGWEYGKAKKVRDFRF